MQCPHCAADLPEDDVYCEVCGLRIIPRPEDHAEVVLSEDCAGVTDRGLKRHRNEDRFAIREADGTFVLVVCDGVSSSHESQLASSAAVAAASGALVRLARDKPEGAMRSAISSAAGVVSELGLRDGADNPPSTTIVAALVNPGEVTVGWLGDSRAYWIAGGQAQQLTSDHAAPNEAHGIIRWLGADAPDDSVPEIVQRPIQDAGVVLLCSDGLWNYAPHPEDIGRLVNGDGDSLAIARRLVEFARSQGGGDNVTAVALRVRAASGESNGG